MMIYRVDTVVSRSYKPCEIYSYDQQITKHFMNKGLRINNIYSELHEGNVLQVCYSVLSDCYSKKVITKKHKMAFDVTTTDFTSVSRYVFENNSSFDLDRLYRTLAEYSVGDNILYDYENEGWYEAGTPPAFILKGNELNKYLDNKYLYCYTCRETSASKFTFIPIS